MVIPFEKFLLLPLSWGKGAIPSDAAALLLIEVVGQPVVLAEEADRVALGPGLLGNFCHGCWRNRYL